MADIQKISPLSEHEKGKAGRVALPKAVKLAFAQERVESATAWQMLCDAIRLAVNSETTETHETEIRNACNLLANTLLVNYPHGFDKTRAFKKNGRATVLLNGAQTILDALKGTPKNTTKLESLVD